MTAPVVEEVIWENISGTTFSINWPSSVTSGELLVPAFCTRDAASVTWPGSVSEIFEQQSDTSSMILSAAARYADGTEGGGSISVSVDASSGTGKDCVHRISGANSDDTTPESAFNDAGGDPPSLSPSGGADDYLFVALYANYFTFFPSAYPSGYTNTNTTSGTNCALAWGSLETSGASSEDPSEFTNGGDASAVSATVAIYPAGIAVALSRHGLMRGIMRGAWRGI